MAGFRPKVTEENMMLDNTTITGTHVLKMVGRMFYLVDPAETSYPDLSSLPAAGYIQQALPYFFSMVALEWIVLYLKGKPQKLADGMMSTAHGLIMSVVELVMAGILFTGYMYIYQHHRLADLPWDSTLTWILAGLGIDFCYYWVHRAAHEINVLWAAHQVHHSSEEYNLTTALRQSVFQGWGAWPFYLPMAFFIPPTHAIIHKELNLLYQFWIHTELVSSIGPLEHVFNTASHHRVHHGANRYCLDKNYAGVLIIWDRMFGTFEWERSDIKIVYGLVDQPQFYNPFKHQLYYYGKVWEKAKSMDNWVDFFSAFVKGPGWFPGTERLGDITFVDERPVREKYAPSCSPLLHLYTMAHFVCAVQTSDLLARGFQGLSQTNGLLLIAYIIWTLTSIGVLYDRSRWAWLGELTRCAVSLMFLGGLAPFTLYAETTLQAVYTGSAVAATVCLVYENVMTNTKHKTQ